MEEYNENTLREGNPEPEIPEKSDFELLIGKNAEYYMPRFNILERKSNKISFNWCAFLFGQYWLFYRKMYVLALLHFFCFTGWSYVLNTLTSLLPDIVLLSGITVKTLATSFLVSPLYLAASVLWGFFSNFIYMRTIQTRAEKMSGLSGQEKEDYLNKQGGTSGRALVLWILIMAAWTVILNIPNWL